MSLENLTPSEFSKWYLLGQAVRRMMGKGEQKLKFSIEWDGDTTNRTLWDGMGISYYKVSELTPTASDLVGCICEGMNFGTLESIIIQADDIRPRGDAIVTGKGNILIVPYDNLKYDNSENPADLIAEKGTYFHKFINSRYATKLATP